MRNKAGTTSTLRATLLRTRQNNDFTLGVEKSIRPILLASLPVRDFPVVEAAPAARLKALSSARNYVSNRRA